MSRTSQQRRARRQSKRASKRSSRQSERTKRVEARQERRAGKQTQRTRRQEARQTRRTERQQVRQENRTRRAEGRQAVRMEKVIQKGESGFYTPEGVAARRMGTAEVVGQAGGIVGDIAPLVAAGLTGGGSLAITEGLGAIGGIVGGMGESAVQSFGGPVGMTGSPPLPPETEIDTKSGFDFSFRNPIVIAGAVATAGALFFLTRPKKKGRAA